MILMSHMILPPVAFMLWIHRATIALRLRFATRMLTTLLAIHRRTAKAITAMSRALVLSAIACSGRIHGAAILRRIHRSPLRLRAIARACHVRAALRLRTGSIAIPLLAGARLVLWRSGGRKRVLLRSRNR